MKCKCKRCLEKHEWTSRLPKGQKPKACPNCKSTLWDKEYQRKRKAK